MHDAAPAGDLGGHVAPRYPIGRDKGNDGSDVSCGGDGAAAHHAVAEGMPHVRIEACRTCRHYLKSVDLRVVGLAVPLVEDLATVELDLWAAEQGLEKIVPNVLGM